MRKIFYISILVSIWISCSALFNDDADVAYCPIYENLSQSDSPSDSQQDEQSLSVAYSINELIAGESTGVSFSRTGHSSLRVNNLSSRTRIISKDRLNVVVTTNYHPRHVTHFLDVDCVKSSMRVDYYLHTLCRLRI